MSEPVPVGWGVMDAEGVVIDLRHAWRREDADTFCAEANGWRYPQRAPWRVVPLYPAPLVGEAERAFLEAAYEDRVALADYMALPPGVPFTVKEAARDKCYAAQDARDTAYKALAAARGGNTE